MKKNYIIIVIIGLIISNSYLVFKTYTQRKELENVYQNSDFLKRKGSVLVFDTYTYNFGVVKLNRDYTSNFSFTNTGSKGIKLKNVLTSCGCTAPVWSKEEILPGQKGNIQLNYHAGPAGEFTKHIGVYLEGDEKPIQLEIKGDVHAR